MIYDLYDSYMFYLSVCLSYWKSIIFNPLTMHSKHII